MMPLFRCLVVVCAIGAAVSGCAGPQQPASAPSSAPAEPASGVATMTYSKTFTTELKALDGQSTHTMNLRLAPGQHVLNVRIGAGTPAYKGPTACGSVQPPKDASHLTNQRGLLVDYYLGDITATVAAGTTYVLSFCAVKDASSGAETNYAWLAPA